ncbi:filamentous hemagglutinin family domain-containing protein [Leptolyngbya sp. Heron Island J]|nr:filamentous hemagglutinin family domain-containing protein [Leptolyngbya sp. Heron Island J]
MTLGLFNYRVLPGITQITPTSDGIGTIVTATETDFSIDGGTQSGNNLFHSFENFSLQVGERANFIAPPSIQNILGRVVSGNASIIDGLVQVTGGSATNLYLLNPAGILFGANAQLNLQGSFTATTANGVDFGNSQFNVLGTNDFSTLASEPSGFIFTDSNPGSVVNTGLLSVEAGKVLTLLGGSVINTGELSAPGGQIILTAVPGRNWVRISQADMLLSLELETISQPIEIVDSFSPLSLAELLTGGNLANASEITLNADGSLQLINSTNGIEVTTGTVIAAGILEVTDTLGGSIHVLGDRVALNNATINASGNDGGGIVRIGGGYQGQESIINATRTYVDNNSVITADALQTGNGGNIIVWADELTGFYGDASVSGGVNGGNGGFIEISGKESLLFDGSVKLDALRGDDGTLLLDPADIRIVPNIGPDDNQLSDDQILSGDGLPADFVIGEAFLESLAGTLLLEATNDITIASGVALNFVTGGPITFFAENNFSMEPASSIVTSGRDLSITAASISANQAIINASVDGLLTAGDITLTANVGGISTSNLDAFATNSGSGGQISLSADGDINTGDINTFAEAVSGNAGQGGNINLFSENGNITTNILRSFSNSAPPNSGNIGFSDNGGAITLNTGNGNIVTGDIFSFTVGRSGNTDNTGGNVQITAEDGAITTGLLETFAFSDLGVPGQGGAIAVSADGTVNIGEINPNLIPTDSNVAMVSIISNLDGVTTGDINNSGQQGGDVNINAAGQITIGVLDTQGFNGLGGNIVVETDSLFRVNGTFLDQNGLTASISSTDDQTGGNIFIRHGGGPMDVPFVVGDASVNGTAGIIASRADNTITPIRSFPESYIQDNIRINTTILSEMATILPEISAAWSETATIQQDTLHNQHRIRSQETPESQLDTDIANLVYKLEENFTTQYETYSRQSGETPIKTLDEIQNELSQVEQATGVRPAIIYAFFLSPNGYLSRLSGGSNEDIWKFISDERINDYSYLFPYRYSEAERDASKLLLMVVTSQGRPVLKPTEFTFADIEEHVDNLQLSPIWGFHNNWITPARSLYQALIAPIESDLENQNINNLVFIMDIKLRSLPLASLQPEEESQEVAKNQSSVTVFPADFPLPIMQDSNGNFIIDKYSVGLMPSISLTDTRYQDIAPTRLLAMGNSEFEISGPRQLSDLPGVESELDFLDQRFGDWRPIIRKEKLFTPEILQTLLKNLDFNILHLATHATYDSSDPANSFIYFSGNGHLSLKEFSKLNLEGIDLLTLSACETALGDEQSELGFAGLAYQLGVKTALASLMQVPDTGTLALMSEFYSHLEAGPIKAEALRQAQLAMKEGRVKISDGNLIITEQEPYALQGSLAEVADHHFQHPFYWAGFTMVGNPW